MVSVQQFKDEISNLGLKLSDVQLTRLVNILDEDMNQQITYKELINALQAFKYRSEQSSPQTAEFMNYEQECFFRLMEVLRSRRVKFSEFFCMLDVNNDGDIDLHEIESVLKSFGEFKIKEIKTLFQAFDIDGNGTI